MFFCRHLLCLDFRAILGLHFYFAFIVIYLFIIIIINIFAASRFSLLLFSLSSPIFIPLFCICNLTFPLLPFILLYFLLTVVHLSLTFPHFLYILIVSHTLSLPLAISNFFIHTHVHNHFFTSLLHKIFSALVIIIIIIFIYLFILISLIPITPLGVHLSSCLIHCLAPIKKGRFVGREAQQQQQQQQHHHHQQQQWKAG